EAPPVSAGGRRARGAGGAKASRWEPLPEGFGELNAFAEAGAIGDAHRVLRRIEHDVPQRLKRMLFNTAIKACAHAGELQVAELYFQAMVRQRVTPSGRSFGKMIHSAVRANDTAAADR
ncbi:unnamed protein product, partial [Prorocentrum cordatum]